MVKIEIEIVALDRLKNEEWFQFFTEYKEMAQDILKDDETFIQFLDLYGQADTVLELIRKSSYTALITEADAKRDTAFRSFRDMVKAMLTHVEPAKQKSAANLTLVLDNYGNLTKKGYSDKTASITNFIQELQENYSEDVNGLGLTEWIVRLHNSNAEFNTLVMKRNDEQSEKLKLSMDDLRRQIGEVYGVMADFIEANARISKEPGWMILFNKLNANIIRYRNTLAKRKGMAKAKREKKTVPVTQSSELPEE